MNNHLIKTVVLCALGGAVGGYIGLKIAELIVDAPVEVVEAVDADEEDIPEDSITVEGVTIDPSKETLVFEETKEEGKPKVSKKPKVSRGATEAVNYNQYHKSDPTTEKASLAELAARYESTPSDEDGTIRIISLQEFVDPANKHDRLELTYYERDDTLCDAAENLIPNPEDILGPDALVHFGMKSEDKDVVYVSNDKLGADYEVVRNHGSYKELVLGMDDDDVPVRKGKPKRKEKQQDEAE